MRQPKHRLKTIVLLIGAVYSAGIQAGVVSDGRGNVGYDTAAECDAAVASGKARFYQPHTEQVPLKRAGEVDVKPLKLSELTTAAAAAKALGYNSADFARGACDQGVGRSNERDGVSAKLIGKWVPYSPDMGVNAYYDAAGQIVRASMKQCDNNFARNLPRPVGAVQQAAATNPTECFATVQIPAKFDTKTEQVVKVPASKRWELIAATYKTVSEQVLVRPEVKRQIPVAATYKTISEEVVVQPASFREEPIAPTYKSVTERILVKPESKRIEVTPATFKTVSEQVLVTPERKVLKVVPAVYEEREEEVEDRPATTRVEPVPATYKTVTEQVLARPESLRYEPIALPLKRVTEQLVKVDASKRLVTTPASYKTVTERVLVKEASKRLVEVPAEFETVTERIKVADSYREWKRGRAWIGQAVQTRPLRGFVVGSDGRVDGSRVEVSAAANPSSRGVVDTRFVQANNANLDDDVMCLVEVPEQYQTITRRVLKSAAGTREVEVPAEYATITRQVLDKEASVSEVEVPALYQAVSRMEVDVEKLKAQGYKFNEKGDIVATPSGERVLRAADVAGKANAGRPGAKASAATGSASGAAETKGAASGEEGYVREVLIPAEYRTVTRTVLDTAATVRTVEVPGTSKVVKTRVVKTPARTVEEVVPAVYRTVERQVVDRPASTREIPIAAEYATLERRVVDQPASVRKIPVPEVRQTISRRVVDTPASLREEVVPAEYKTITRQVVDSPASTRELDVPAVYETLSRQVLVSEARVEQRSVLCETNATPGKIREIQRALSAAGFNPGPINGVLRAQTMSAVNAYQQAKGLPVDGFLNIETVKSLGVSAF
jgi:hypothetical protein